MANTLAAFGFRQIGTAAGSAPTFNQTKYRIASGNTHAIYFGDPVIPIVTGGAGLTGYIDYGAAQGANAPTVSLTGIFYGCTYISVSQKRRIWSQYWPGSDANGDVTAYVCDDPNAKFVVQAGNTNFDIGGTTSALSTSPIGQYAVCQMGTGSTSTGLSGAYLYNVATAPSDANSFIVLDLVTDPPGSNGSDPTTAYNYVIVGFNAEALRGNSATTAGA